MPAYAIVLPNAGISRCQTIRLSKGRPRMLRKDQRRHFFFPWALLAASQTAAPCSWSRALEVLNVRMRCRANPSYRLSLTPASESAFRAAPPLPQPSAKDALCERRASSATER